MLRRRYRQYDEKPARLALQADGWQIHNAMQIQSCRHFRAAALNANTGEFPERAIQKDHLNARWPLQSIARGEMLPDAFEMNIDSGFEMAFILPENLDPAAPRQKVRILRHIVYQIEHLLGGMRD